MVQGALQARLAKERSSEVIAQLVEHRAFNSEVEGSSPSGLTFFGLVAQLAERRPLEPNVPRSSRGRSVFLQRKGNHG